MIRWPAYRRVYRWLPLLYGVAVFIWLSLEDSSAQPVILLGLGGAVLLVGMRSLLSLGGKAIEAKWLPALTALLGLLSGLGAAVWVTALMFFKNARHSHIYPDYPAEQMLLMLRQGPLWALAGALIGLSLGLGWLALRPAEAVEQP